jgi:hypothetical protein
VTREEELEHAIRAACDVSGDDELWVFGSQAILGQYPDAPGSLRQSAEADVVPRNLPDKSDLIDGVLGLDSMFHRQHGFYVHGVSLETATLPEGWQDRTVAVRGRGTKPSTGYCVEGHDLAASKLVAFREKDRAFVRTLLAEGMVDPEALIQRIHSLPVDEDQQKKLERWVRANASS